MIGLSHGAMFNAAGAVGAQPASVKAGARMVKLEANFEGGGIAGPAKSYD